ncbi:hypothetical protein BH10BAC5_BH10BAC5_25480 [soil metagenome]
MDLTEITNKKYSFIFGNKSDVGRVREINEDYMESFPLGDSHYFIVCDGMGGHSCGEIASRLAVITIKEYISANFRNSNSTKQLLTEAVQNANQTIIDKAAENSEYQGMGTTSVILCLKSGIAYYANVGDSRLYIVRENKIYQLTKDQSFVQTLIDQGHISYDEAESHPRKNELIQALGITENVVPEVNSMGLQIYKGDKFILCSDGLSGFATDDNILSAVEENDVFTASEKLVDLANANGGFDNITVQVVSINEGDDLPEDLKAIRPMGALDKNISVSNFSRDNKSTRQIPEFDFGHEYEKKRSKYPFIFITLVLLAGIGWGIFYYFIREKEKTVINSENNNSITKQPEEYSNNLKLRIFFDSIYGGEKTNPEIKMTQFPSIKFETINYTDKSRKPQPFSFTELIDRIRKEDLTYVSYDTVKSILEIIDRDRNHLKYKIKSEPIIVNENKVDISILSLAYLPEENNQKEVRDYENKKVDKVVKDKPKGREQNHNDTKHEDNIPSVTKGTTKQPLPPK